MELFSNANIAMQTAYGHVQNRQMTKQASGEVVMHKEQRTTPEDGHTIMTETCRVF
jgi:hypothetical protein